MEHPPPHFKDKPKHHHSHLHHHSAEPVVIERDEALVTPITLGKSRWWFIAFYVLTLVAACAFAVSYQPQITTNHPTAVPLPFPEWWQIVIGTVLGLGFGVFFGVYIAKHLDLDKVTST